MRAALVIALLAAAFPARADLREEAKHHLDEAQRAFAEQRFAVALDELQQAYALAPHPDLLFNIGRCHEELHHWRDAVDAYDRYLAVAPDDTALRAHTEELRPRALAEPPPSPPPLPALGRGRAAFVPVAAAKPSVPIYQRWWLWTGLGAAAAIAIAVGLSVGITSPSPSLSFPALTAR